MTAAQPVWTDDPRHYGGQPFTLGRVWIGITRTPPELLVAALSDPEDTFPTFKSHMSNPDDPREAATTPAPPTDPDPGRERDTQPPGAADADATARYTTMLPKKAPATLEDTYLDKAIRVVANAGANLARDRDERQQQHQAVMDAIVRSESSNLASWTAMKGQLDSWRKLSEAKDADQDQKIAALESGLAKLEGEVVAMRTILEELKANGTRTSQAPAAEPT